MIKEFRPDKDRIARKRRIIGRALRDALANQGDEFAGFALVTWDNRGNATSAFYADTGPIGESMLPLFVYGQLIKHGAVLLAERDLTSREEGK